MEVFIIKTLARYLHLMMLIYSCETFMILFITFTIPVAPLQLKICLLKD